MKVIKRVIINPCEQGGLIHELGSYLPFSNEIINEIMVKNDLIEIYTKEGIALVYNKTPYCIFYESGVSL